jgi:hypothetical protein
MPKNPHAPEYIRQDASFFTDMSNDKDMLQFTNRKKSEDGMFYNAEGAGDSTAKLVETEEPREADHPLTLVEESNQDKYAAILALEKQALSRAEVGRSIGRVSAEVVSGIPARIGLVSAKRGVKRADKAVTALQQELRKAKPPKKGAFTSSKKHRKKLLEFSKKQRGMSQAVADMKQQKRVFSDHEKALRSHIKDIRSNPWSAELRLPK